VICSLYELQLSYGLFGKGSEEPITIIHPAGDESMQVSLSLDWKQNI